MESTHVMILAIVIYAYLGIDAELNVRPRDTEVKINDSTYLYCSTSLQADLVQWRHGNNYVYTGIDILEPYNDGRFSVEINASRGASNLVIRSVQKSDAGTYKCLEDEGFGETSSAELIVLDYDPICKSNMRSDGFIGPNSCGIEPDEIKLSCSVTYHGNLRPVLQWKKSGANHSIADEQFNVTSSNYEVTYTLTMNSTLVLNNSSFVCQTTRTSDKSYSCSSDTISISYVFKSEVTANVTMNDEINCFANSSQSCSYKWKWFSGDDVTTESEDHILKPKKVGYHRCEATCFFAKTSCTVESMNVKVVSYAGSIEVGKRESQETELQPPHEQQQSLLEQQREEERLRSLGLITTISRKAAVGVSRGISGLTILDNELFVVSDECSEVDIYDSVKYSFIRRWNLNELISPLDIASCSRNKCLYISDYKDPVLNEIIRVDSIGNVMNEWSTKGYFGLSLSITYESNVILSDYNKSKLIEYTPDGLLIRVIHLPLKEDFRYPTHAVKLTSGHFVVSHGSHPDDLHRVCIVDANGKLLKSFGGKLGSANGQMEDPLHLCVDVNGFVMVADYRNTRVLLLDTNLVFKKEILSEEHGLRDPVRIHLDEINGRLLVADSEPHYERIMIFKI